MSELKMTEQYEELLKRNQIVKITSTGLKCSVLTVGQIREAIADLPDDAPVGIDYNGNALTVSSIRIPPAWGAWTDGKLLAICRG